MRRMGRGWIEEEQGRRERVKQVGGGRGCYAMTMGTSSEKPLIIGSSSSSSPEEGRKKENQTLTSLLCDLKYLFMLLLDRMGITSTLPSVCIYSLFSSALNQVVSE